MSSFGAALEIYPEVERHPLNFAFKTQNNLTKAPKKDFFEQFFKKSGFVGRDTRDEKFASQKGSSYFDNFEVGGETKGKPKRRERDYFR